MEEEATRIQQERLTAEEENRTLRETVFESQGRARAAEAALKRVQAEAADRDKQLRIMTDQNAELLRLLEQEEAQTARLSAANEVPTRSRFSKLVVEGRNKRHGSYTKGGQLIRTHNRTKNKADLRAPPSDVVFRSSGYPKSVLHSKRVVSQSGAPESQHRIRTLGRSVCSGLGVSRLLLPVQ